MRDRAIDNPLLDLKKELVVALTSVGGLHWGACEFGKRASGDLMHFDLGFVPDEAKGSKK